MAHIPAPSQLRQGGLGGSLGAAAAGSRTQPPPRRDTNHLLQDTGPAPAAASQAVWLPSFGLMFRIIVIARLVAARFTVIADCDETYNYWEALHLLVFPPAWGARLSALLPFQTWEYAPQFAIRSYAYLLPYAGFVKLVMRVLKPNKMDVFYLVRNMLAMFSAFAEARFCVSVAETVHPRVARYTFFILLGATGMTSAATALLPSSFTMYTTTLALAYAFYPSRLPSPNSVPAPSNLSLTPTPFLRTTLATSVFALGAILGWPFAIVLAIPFVAEELFLPSGNQVPAAKYAAFIGARLLRFVQAALLAGLFIGGITTAIDTLAYGRFTVVSAGIVIYNILSAKRGAGPELYGTEPASFYFANLALAFNILLPLALLSLPLLGLVFLVDSARLGTPARSFPLTSVNSKEKDKKDGLVASSRLGLLVFRLAPFYVWLGLLTLQPHKEERFMFPAYPLLCFNAAVSIYFLRSLLEMVVSKSQAPPSNPRQRAQSSRLPSTLSVAIILLTTLISISRSLHLQLSFNAPTSVLEHFHNREAPKLLARAFPNRLAGSKQKARLASGLDAFGDDENEEKATFAESAPGRTSVLPLKRSPKALPALTGLVDMSLLVSEFGGAAGSGKPAPIRLCYGKEWYRFPGHFFVPHGVNVEFVKSEFAGILPKHYASSAAGGGDAKVAPPPGVLEARVVRTLEKFLGWSWGLSDITRTMQSGFNDLNQEEPDRYVSIDTCDYLVDVDHPHRYAATGKAASDPLRKALEPRYAIDSQRWTRVHCLPFLDVAASASATAPTQSGPLHKVLALVDRTLYVPVGVRVVLGSVLRAVGLGRWESARAYGDYCLLRTTRENSWANRRGTFTSLSEE